MSERGSPPTWLAAVDLTELGAWVLDQAIERAAREHAVLHVVHVASPGALLDLEDTAYPRHAPLQQDLERSLVAKVRQRLELAVEVPERVAASVRFGDVAGEIIAAAAELAADSILVGAPHGKRRIRWRARGSVAQEVVAAAPCPVVVMREQAHPAPEIERPCPECVATRGESGGRELWCPRHRHRLGRRHTYHFVSRNVSAQENAPLVVHSSAASAPLRH
jgi:nucleotide-binding universal stress UspA family protein